jgi:hypothetical protein
VKKSVAMVLLCLHLMSGTELHELWRLPILVSHYFEHNSNGLSTSFGQFIALHYLETEAHDERDMELPFKQHDSCLTSVVMAILPTFQIAQPASIAVSHSYQFLELNLPLNFYRADIWQPPRA